jgi:hypothetical protein
MQLPKNTNVTVKEKAKPRPEPEHLDWLVANRAANQRASAKLYRLLRECSTEARNKSFGGEAQMLISISFSLWRSAFLSDKTGKFKDTHQGAELFLEEMLMNNAIAYSQDRGSKDWTFNYYASNASYRIHDYCKKYRRIKIGPLRSSIPKQRWERLETALEKLIDHFGKRLRKAARPDEH